jgi:hypothetical protein
MKGRRRTFTVDVDAGYAWWITRLAERHPDCATVVETTPFDPQPADIVRSNLNGRLFRVLARDRNLLWMKDTGSVDTYPLVSDIANVGPSR